ncbi:MAG: D-2-hydroxyacid dehydrogenase [bacterium]
MNLLIKYRYNFKEIHLEKILSARDDINLVDSIEAAEVILGGISKEEFEMAKNLRWIQATGAGVDGLLFPELIDSNVILTNASGVHPIPIAEHTFALILAITRGLIKSFEGKDKRAWLHNEVYIDELYGKTIGIVGYGRIGQGIARLAKGFGMKIIGLKRQLEKRVEVKPDILLGKDSLDILLKESDIVVLIVPLTKETYHLIGERELRMMKPTSILINVARGKVIDESALIKALKERWIFAAGLDVFETEPLPPESELWDLDNVVITPHIAGLNPYYTDRLLDIFIRNLKAYPDVSKMVNVVDKRLGY